MQSLVEFVGVDCTTELHQQTAILPPRVANTAKRSLGNFRIGKPAAQASHQLLMSGPVTRDWLSDRAGHANIQALVQRWISS
jgi:hypothetical protein